MPFMDLIKRFKDMRILVIGDLILDRYIWGSVSRISPEAPVPVVDVESDSYMLGGAANVANNIISLGGRATVLGVVGKDRAAERVEAILRENGIRFLAIEDARPTTVKTRVVAHGQHVVRFDREHKQKIAGQSLRALMAFLRDELANHDAVIVSDYKKGVVTARLMRELSGAAKAGTFVAVDPKVGHFDLYKGASLITPNLKEASEGSGIEITDEDSLVKAGRRLLGSLGLGSVLITRGDQGMSLFVGKEVMHIPTLARKVFDVTGAGDTVIGTYAMAHAAGATPWEAAVLSNHAAGIVVAEVGTAVATPQRLRQSLKSSRNKLERK